jgi:hypothetical protein
MFTRAMDLGQDLARFASCIRWATLVRLVLREIQQPSTQEGRMACRQMPR